MSWIEHKYLDLISIRLRNFKRKGGALWNFSCPFCGDSDRNSRRARAYVYEREGRLFFYCHNHGGGRRFDRFLRDVDPELYREMALEEFGESGRKSKFEPVRGGVEEMARSAARPFRSPRWATPLSYLLQSLDSVAKLEEGHEARLLLESRGIPRDSWLDFFYAPDFPRWASVLLPEKFKPRSEPEPRLVIPFLDGQDMYGFQGRAFGPSQAKYVTGMIDTSKPLLYGWPDSRAPEGERTIVVEGPIDSVLLRGAIASAGGNITRELSRLEVSPDEFVVAYDNEPRSRQNVDHVRSAIEAGWNVFVWPKSIPSTVKDINDWHLQNRRSGMSDEQSIDLMSKIIRAEARSGLEAELALIDWKRC